MVSEFDFWFILKFYFIRNFTIFHCCLASRRYVIALLSVDMMQVNEVAAALCLPIIFHWGLVFWQSPRATDLYTMGLNYNGTVNEWRSVHGRRVYHGFHVGHLWRLYLHHLRGCIVNRCVNQRLLVDDRCDGRLVLLKEDLRHHVVVHWPLIHGCVVKRLLIDWRVWQHGFLVDGHHGLDVLDRLMQRLIVHRGRHRLHIRDSRFRYHGAIGGLLDILEVSQWLNAQLFLQIGLLDVGFNVNGRWRIRGHVRVDRSARLVDRIPLRLQHRNVWHFVHQRAVRHVHMRSGLRAHRRQPY